MATSSILTDFTIKDRKTAEAFVKKRGRAKLKKYKLV